MFAWLGAGADADADTDPVQQSENRPSAANASSSQAAIKPTTDNDTFSEPECDYDRHPTQLYKLIEAKRWDAAVVRAQSCPEEAATWVCRREKGGGGGGAQQIRWRLLPLHATCVFRSPLSLIEALIEAYPDGTQMKDVSFHRRVVGCLLGLGLAFDLICTDDGPCLCRIIYILLPSHLTSVGYFSLLLYCTHPLLLCC